MRQITPKLWSWGSNVEQNTLDQAEALSRLPIIDGHVALMPDAHLGIGSTVGSVIPTRNAVIPAAVGVDIGCGMIAAETNLGVGALPDDLYEFVRAMHVVVPAGMGKRFQEPSHEAVGWWSDATEDRGAGIELTAHQNETAEAQLGTLGGGNHFLEIALDEQDWVWVLIHSGSRGIGNQIAKHHMKVAREVCDYDFLQLRGQAEDKALAWLEVGTPEFDAYISDLRLAQDYALQNRKLMIDAAIGWLFDWVGQGEVVRSINCHHNFTELDDHRGDVWITRKGAVKATVDDWGLIPGSMGQRSYIVRGKGNRDSYYSCAHGAGRRLSRTAARKQLTIETFSEKMAGSAWQSRLAAELLDEHPDAYKDIDQVMKDQEDLVHVEHRLRAIANYKGTS